MLRCLQHSSIFTRGRELGPGFLFDPHSGTWVNVTKRNRVHNKQEEDGDDSSVEGPASPTLPQGQQFVDAIDKLTDKFTTKIAEITTTSSHPPASPTSLLPPEPELTEHEKKMKDYYDTAVPNMDRDPTYPAEDIKKTIELCKRPENALAVRQNWVR